MAAGATSTWSSTSATTSTSTTRTRTRRRAATCAANSNHEIVNLADYRERHAQYKTDPDLQAAHAAFPWLVTFDDHEIDNNWAGEVPEEGMPHDVFMRRRKAAFRAYWEHMPLRRPSRPVGPDIQIYRRCAVRQPGDVPRDRHAPVPLRPGVRGRRSKAGCDDRG